MGWKNKESKRAYQRKWYAAHREKVNEKHRQYYWATLEKQRDRSKKYRLAHQEEERRKKREYIRRYRLAKVGDAEYQEKERVRRTQYQKSPRAVELRKLRWVKLKALFAVDARAYAEYRSFQRFNKALLAIERGRKFRPRMWKRIPDWACMGEKILDTRSQFLEINLTPSQRAYALSLYLERRKK